MTLEERAKRRRQRIVAARSTSFEEAEKWDLKYWQSLSPEERLEAFMAIREDVEKVHAARERDADTARTNS